MATDKHSNKDVAEAWIKYQSSIWAAEAMERLCRKEPHAALDCILVILDQDEAGPSGTLVQNLAAGPLEDLLSHHGVALIDQVEKFAKQNRKFRTLLGGVWQNAMPDEVWERIVKVRDGNW